MLRRVVATLRPAQLNPERIDMPADIIAEITVEAEAVVIRADGTVKPDEAPKETS